MKKTAAVFSILILCFALTGCSNPQESLSPTVSPTTTVTPQPTHTPVPTTIPTPTITSTPVPTAAPTSTPMPSPTPSASYSDINWDNYVAWSISNGLFAVKNNTVGTHLVYFYPKDYSEDITFCLFEENVSHRDFSTAEYKLSEALYIFPDVRENNPSIGKFKDIYHYHYWDISFDGLADFYYIGIYEKDGIEYYDTRIYLAYETEDGILFQPDYERMTELNEKYSRVDGTVYPVAEELNDDFYFPLNNFLEIPRFLPEEVAVSPAVPQYEFDTAKEYGIAHEITGTLPDGTIGTWYTIHIDDVEYYYARPEGEAASADLIGYTIFSENCTLPNGLSIGMTFEELRAGFRNLVAIDFENNYYLTEGKQTDGWNYKLYPHSLPGSDTDYLWSDQFDYLFLADIVQENDTAPLRLGLLMKDDIVAGITFYPPFTVDEEKMVHSLKAYLGENLHSSASKPHVLFADAESGMIVFGQGANSYVYATKDGGITWQQREIPPAGHTMHALITCATALDEQRYCVGYRYWGEYVGVNLYLTLNQGTSWIRLPLEIMIPEEIAVDMRYAEVVGIDYEAGTLTAQVSCKTISGKPWSIEVTLESKDTGRTWTVIEKEEKPTDAE